MSSPSKKPRPSLGDEFKVETVRIAQATQLKPEWRDWHSQRGLQAKKKSREREQRLLALPGEVLDRILADETLNLRDHLSLAATCRTLRACYYTPLPSDFSTPDSPLWTALAYLRPSPANGARRPAAEEACTEEEAKTVQQIWTGKEVNPLEMEVVGKGPFAVEVSESKGKKRQWAQVNGWEGKAVRSYGWERAILLVHASKLTKTETKSIYKLSDKELNMLAPIVKRNPRQPKTGQIYLFTEAAVESLALRLHGGEKGHEEFLAERAARNKRAADTRARNASKSTPSPSTSSSNPYSNLYSPYASHPSFSSNASTSGWNASSPAVHKALREQFGMTDEQARNFAQYQAVVEGQVAQGGYGRGGYGAGGYGYDDEDEEWEGEYEGGEWDGEPECG